MRLKTRIRACSARLKATAVTGVFALLVLEDEKYLELLAGLSRSAAAYDELLCASEIGLPRLSGGLCL